MIGRLDAVAAGRSGSVAIADGKSTRTYGQLARDVKALASELRPGAIVASLLPSGVPFTTLQLATLEARATFFPLPPDATPTELGHALSLAVPDLVFLGAASGAPVKEALPAHVPRVVFGEAVPAHGAEAGLSAAMVQLTSGSTGRPKGVLLEPRALEAGVDDAASFAEAFAGSALFSPMPQYHAMGGALVLEHLLHGVSVHVAARFVPGDDLRRMQEAEVALLAGPPAYFRTLLRLGLFKKELPGLRALLMGSAAAERELLLGLRELLPSVSLHLRYGLSETFGSLTRADIEAGAPLPAPGFVGQPLASVRLAPLPALEEPAAELRATGPTVAETSLHADGQRALRDAEGFFPTGDVAHAAEGAVHLRGRSSEMIKRFGFRVDPSEIEQLLVGHPAVRDAVVLPVPDPLAGSAIVACLDALPDAEAELRARCAEHLGPRKRPQRFVFPEAFPRTPAGKPDRGALRRLLAPAAANPSANPRAKGVTP